MFNDDNDEEGSIWGLGGVWGLGSFGHLWEAEKSVSPF